MASPLEKARKNPNSMKAKILKVAKKLFSEYGYHGTTTRMISKEVGIDISTLYYHWGEKGDLYEAVVLDITNNLREKLVMVEKKIKGLPLKDRMEIAIDMLADYFFKYPEISSLTVSRTIIKIRREHLPDLKVPDYISDIVVSMGLDKDKESVSVKNKMKIMAIMSAIHNFVSGEVFFSSILDDIEHEKYIKEAKETLKFIMIPAFAD